MKENSHFAKISSDIYNEFILYEKQKLLAKEIDFLVDNYFFNAIKHSSFKSRYFYNFVKTDYRKGKRLVKCNEPCEKLFFIREGEVELKIEISLNELIRLINETILKTNCFKNAYKYVDYRGKF